MEKSGVVSVIILIIVIIVAASGVVVYVVVLGGESGGLCSNGEYSTTVGGEDGGYVESLIRLDDDSWRKFEDKYRKNSTEALEDISDLECLERLSLKRETESIISRYAGATDISPVANLKNMKYLGANLGDVDLSPLSELENLERLSMVGAGVSDISPLAGLNKLEEFYCSYCENLVDVSSLKDCPALKKIDIRDTSVTVGVEKLVNLPNLKRLWVTGTPYEVEGRCPALKELFKNGADHYVDVACGSL